MRFVKQDRPPAPAPALELRPLCETCGEPGAEVRPRDRGPVVLCPRHIRLYGRVPAPNVSPAVAPVCAVCAGEGWRWWDGRRESCPGCAGAPSGPATGSSSHRQRILCGCGAVRDTGAACAACGELEAAPARELETFEAARLFEPAPAQIPGQTYLEAGE